MQIPSCVKQWTAVRILWFNTPTCVSCGNPQRFSMLSGQAFDKGKKSYIWIIF